MTKYILVVLPFKCRKPFSDVEVARSRFSGIVYGLQA